MSEPRLDALRQEIATLMEWEGVTARASHVASGVTRVATTHVTGLLEYAREHLDPPEGGPRPPTEPLENLALGSEITDAARIDPLETYAIFAVGALRYAKLAATALRLFEPPLRELAPAYQQDYADMAFALADELASTVASELADRDLECHCVCPMCSLGLCGCIAVGRAIATRHLREIEERAPSEGFSIPAPRSFSQLASADCRGGHRLLAIDGRPVRTVMDIQSAIRQHAIGESLDLLIDDGVATRTVRVTHVHDYP
ncbi:MAG: hypothetical protein ACYCRG_02130 [Acidimicrobiales bacterium]